MPAKNRTAPPASRKVIASLPKSSNAAPGATLAERIRQTLERDIVGGRLAPGTKLDEDDLAAQHGASRTPVREALQHLASQGLIELRPHAGAFVPAHGVVELAEMFEAMAFLEAACAALAARRHSAEDRHLLGVAHEACAKAAKRDDPQAFYAANRHFHGCIYRAAHNQYLAAQTAQLGNRLEAYRREATFHPGLMSLTMAEHERILDAIFAMDEGTAGAQMRSHLDTLRDDAVSMATAMQRASRQAAR
ncbi:MAG TPA: GntR family transcriptional regulator [Casimicrobiaceae bacterium]|nr:GntR family transcriptional regulator [Casimicrobiaceae bacterium]